MRQGPTGWVLVFGVRSLEMQRAPEAEDPKRVNPVGC